MTDNIDPNTTEATPAPIQLGSTQIVEDAPVAGNESYRGYRYETDPSIAVMSDQNSIADFLQKPVEVINFNWNIVSAENAELLDLRITDLLSDVGVATSVLWREKLKGYAFFKATLHVRLQVNAEPFQAGMLIMTHTPLAYDISSAGVGSPNEKWRWCFSNIANRYQLPCVELDIRNTSAVLKCPFILPSEAYALNETEAQFDLGVVNIAVVSPLTTGASGANNVECSLWAHFEDVQLYGPNIPEANGMIQRYGKPRSNDFEVIKFNRKPIAESEKNALNQRGPMEALANQVQSVAHSASQIPILAPLARPVSWISGVARGLASFAGFSKPLSDEVSHPMYQRNNHQVTTAYGNALAENLGLMTDNSLAISDNFAESAYDEMSFEFLRRIETPIFKFEWSTTDPHHTKLLQKSIGPSGAHYLFNLGNVDWRAFPPMLTIARYFALWRGGFCLRIKIVKTQFHSGRLSVVWLPRTSTTLTTVAEAQAPYALREIVDIRESDSITIELPFIRNTEFLERNQDSGQLFINVINELRAPPSVSESVEVFGYLSCCDDFVVSQYVGTAGLSDPFQGAPECAGDYPEAAEGTAEICNTNIGGFPMTRADYNSAQQTSGETCCSIKTMLLRYHRLRKPTQDTGHFDVGYCQILHHNPVDTSLFIVGTSLYDGMCPLLSGYALKRGSYRLFLPGIQEEVGIYATGTSSNRTPNFRSNTVPVSYENEIGLEDPGTHGMAMTSFDASLRSGPVHVQFPQSAKTKSIMNRVQLANVPSSTSIPYSSDYSQNVNYLAFGPLPLGLGNAMRAVGDDFQLGAFIGFPPFRVGLATIVVA